MATETILFLSIHTKNVLELFSGMAIALPVIDCLGVFSCLTWTILFLCNSSSFVIFLQIPQSSEQEEQLSVFWQVPSPHQFIVFTYTYYKLFFFAPIHKNNSFAKQRQYVRRTGTPPGR